VRPFCFYGTERVRFLEANTRSCLSGRDDARLAAKRRSVDRGPLKTTRYFEEQVLRKRPYIQREWCERAIAKPLRWEVQPDGRIRHWVEIPELAGRFLRVVTLADGETIHNAFPDRNFKP